MNWARLCIAVVAGDRREQEIARCAADTGAQVRAFGFPWPEQGIAGVMRTASLGEALAGADVALFPIPGIAPDGALYAPALTERVIPGPDHLACMRRPAHIVLGWADARLRQHCDALGITLHEYEWDQALMLRRAPAIVEGMLRVVIENTDITIHKARICQIGQGSIGALATRTLLALGAHVHVIARNPVQRAAAYAAGAEVFDLDALPALLPTADIVITSVPARVLAAAQLDHVRKTTLLVDLAAPPGGIDREAAVARGLRAIWARGLGSRAPITVGRSQWGGIRDRIEAACGAAP